MFNVSRIAPGYLLDTSMPAEILLDTVILEIPAANLMEMNVRGMMQYGIEGLLTNAECDKSSIDHLLDVLVEDTIDGLMAVANGYQLTMGENETDQVADIALEIFTVAADRLVGSGLLAMTADYIHLVDDGKAYPQLFKPRPLGDQQTFCHLLTNQEAIVYAEKRLRSHR